MATDLQLSSAEYSMALVISFISYVIFEIPSNFILSRTRPSIYIATVMTLWGIVICCIGYEQLLALRFVLGSWWPALSPE
ncbi:hypothetical protein GQ53DRAFT_528460 [Thozetella sp. PMI_491]|nr:hypothetical protein GQ53DRAFT_528460 [Thozetella sp. PMI_491]